MKPEKLYSLLEERFGDLRWWPAKTPFEVMVGALLTQNTAWRNVEKAIANLRKEKMLSVKRMAQASKTRIAELVKPAGYYNQKAERLILLAKHLQEKYQGSLKKFFNQETNSLRQELLALKGVGPETADSILLYAAGKPVFVVDAYTKRVIERLGLMNENELNYDSVQEFFEASLPQNSKLFNQFHALLVELAKTYCRKKPLCAECFLKEKCRNFSEANLKS